MKINDKNLISFAISKSCIDKEGWLGKKGEVNKSFQKRWFVLKGNLLFYFEKKDDKEPLGLIILEGCTVELAENGETYSFKLVFHGSGNRTYMFCSNSQETMEEWMRALASASYDYVKLMVAELQRQLDEMTEMERSVKLSSTSQFKCRGIPSNQSDGCLFGHAAAGGRAQRFNPFDRWKSSEAEGCESQEGTSSVAITAAASEDDLLHHSAQRRPKGMRQKYLFLELHEYYGQIFRRLFAEQKKKKQAALPPKSAHDLISF